MTAFASSAGDGHDRPDPEESFVGFIFSGEVPIGKIADFYGFPVPNAEKAKRLAEFLSDHLHGRPTVGDGVRVAEVELVIQGVDGNHITRAGLALDPQARLTRRSFVAKPSRWHELAAVAKSVAALRRSLELSFGFAARLLEVFDISPDHGRDMAVAAGTPRQIPPEPPRRALAAGGVIGRPEAPSLSRRRGGAARGLIGGRPPAP